MSINIRKLFLCTLLLIGDLNANAQKEKVFPQWLQQLRTPSDQAISNSYLPWLDEGSKQLIVATQFYDSLYVGDSLYIASSSLSNSNDWAERLVLSSFDTTGGLIFSTKLAKSGKLSLQQICGDGKGNVFVLCTFREQIEMNDGQVLDASLSASETKYLFLHIDLKGKIIEFKTFDIEYVAAPGKLTFINGKLFLLDTENGGLDSLFHPNSDFAAYYWTSYLFEIDLSGNILNTYIVPRSNFICGLENGEYILGGYLYQNTGDLDYASRDSAFVVSNDTLAPPLSFYTARSLDLINFYSITSYNDSGNFQVNAFYTNKNTFLFYGHYSGKLSRNGVFVDSYLKSGYKLFVFAEKDSISYSFISNDVSTGSVSYCSIRDLRRIGDDWIWLAKVSGGSLFDGYKFPNSVPIKMVLDDQFHLKKYSDYYFAGPADLGYNIPITSTKSFEMGRTNGNTFQIDWQSINTNQYSTAIILTDSHEIYTKVLETPNNTNSDFTVYPNPFSEQLFINIGLPAGQYVKASLFDLSGKYVFDIGRVYLTNGRNQMLKDRIDAPPGCYLLKLDTSLGTKHYLLYHY